MHLTFRLKGCRVVWMVGGWGLVGWQGFATKHGKRIELRQLGPQRAELTGSGCVGWRIPLAVGFGLAGTQVGWLPDAPGAAALEGAAAGVRPVIGLDV